MPSEFRAACNGGGQELIIDNHTLMIQFTEVVTLESKGFLSFFGVDGSWSKIPQIMMDYCIFRIP